MSAKPTGVEWRYVKCKKAWKSCEMPKYPPAFHSRLFEPPSPRERVLRIEITVRQIEIYIGEYFSGLGHKIVQKGESLMKKRVLLLTVTLVLAMAAIITVQLTTDSLPTAAWGLSFHQPGSPPSGPASAEELARYDAAYLGDTNRKVLYLTFDAGYENGCTEKILDVLKKHNVKAAFFLVGNYMERNADLVRRMVEEGHIVGNHTMHHYDMSKLEEKTAFEQELTGLEELFRNITGKELPKYYRPPQGTYSQKNLQLAKGLGYKTVFWSLAYVDWNNDAQPTAQQAFDKLLPRTHDGAVVLLHSTSQTNAQILDELLTRWSDQGYVFETINKLFE